MATVPADVIASAAVDTSAADAPAAGARVAIAILSKAPVAGCVKTRLIPHLGAARAASLQRWLLHHTLATALEANIGPVSLWCAPDTHHPDFQRYRGVDNVTLHEQAAGDLGQRMHAAMAAFPSCRGTLVIGTDCPAMDAAALRRAARELERGNDAVLIPAEDGGYVLIGMQAAAEAPFGPGIAWSTDQVAEQTRARFSALDWRWAEPATLWDVDRVSDYRRLCQLFPVEAIFSTAPLE